MTTTISVRPGPLKVTGPVTIIDPAGTVFEVAEDGVVVLCRCGQSSNKPFCDATHKTVGFDHQEPVDPERLPAAVRLAG